MVNIDEFTSAGALDGTELVEVLKGGVNRKTTTQEIANKAVIPSSQVTDFDVLVDNKIVDAIDVPNDTAKTTPVDADVFTLWDSVDTFLRKKVTRANIKATLMTYFDMVYLGITDLRQGLTANKILATDALGNEGYIDDSNFIKLSDGFFGNGSDGNVTISSNTTLSRDMFYNNLTVNNGIILNTGGYRIFCKGTLTNNGTISRNGNNGTNGQNAGTGGGGSTGNGGAGGVALSNGTVYGSLAGGNGGGASGNPGNGGGASNVGNSQTGSNGGNGGDIGSLSGTNLTGGAGGTATLEKSLMRRIFDVTGLTADGTEQSWGSQILYLCGITTGFTLAGSGSGGGGESGTASSSGNIPRAGGGGGGGGSAGGVVYISAQTIINNGTISSIGGNGGAGGIGASATGTSNEASGGSGGGGGGGGLIVCIYSSKSGSGNYTVSGGTGGAGGTVGLPSYMGTGPTGGTGTAGQNGKILYVKV